MFVTHINAPTQKKCACVNAARGGIYAAFGNPMWPQISVTMKYAHIKLKLECMHNHEGSLLLVLTHAHTHT